MLRLKYVIMKNLKNKIMKQSFADRLFELKNDALQYIENYILKGKESNKYTPKEPLKTIVGDIFSLEIDTAGCFVDLDGAPYKLKALSNETIIQIAHILTKKL